MAAPNHIHTRIQTTPSPYAEAVGFSPADPATRRLAASTTSATTTTTKSLPSTTRVKSKKKQIGSGSGRGVVGGVRYDGGTFPAPLVLPPDDLAWDPEYGPQGFASWLNLRGRNKPESSSSPSATTNTTAVRKTRKKAADTIYVVEVPDVDEKGVGFMRKWTSGGEGKVKKGATGAGAAAAAATKAPRSKGIIEYLTAFYHGFPVKRFPQGLRFVPWPRGEGEKESKTGSPFVGLAYGSTGNITRIRTRLCPDGKFEAQLNLNDLLDAAIEMLPKDAFAIVLLVDQDMYEDEEDDFCCGRAYGGSRVCVVSSARYKPSLDEEDPLQEAGCGDGSKDHNDHSWPASHCQRYVKGVCRAADEADGIVEEKPSKKKRRKNKKDEEEEEEEDDSEWPMRAALVAAEKWDMERIISGRERKTRGKEEEGEEEEEAEGLWLSRVCRTVAHELGHCLAMDHCVYYACSMQGTAGLAEDVRQPPYLCPVCLTKLSWAVVRELGGGGWRGWTGERAMEEYVLERYKALARYCEKDEIGGVMKMFTAYGAWIRARIKQLEEEGGEEGGRQT